jgi:hypothetical protein
MLVSGDDSITRAGSLEVDVLEVALEVALAAAVPVEVAGALEVEFDEQAARPAARRPVAVSASALLLVILLIVNFDLSFRG